ncbi:hypothetical protein A3B85_01855 [Candidatus Nomurabacteria bacterium RIFCSPHIGHO2_02_FULL_37_13]|uniref:YknX-like beta-barrel domain-containing protein n=1 Tax=Candidatus Nomurabacteria bacterium RIFCSPHIGHO2_02_FULL_37_13 TaxID=1801750 RepID=A0A1F6W4Z4_9BACT|nr:MAG: hypothetical protein A2640_02560 [Candidatus Nomurabacteria bacterium RIFCSPHIGHO2_01_FULL_36_23]OGI76836.1 MAG: hypothetical protein A3B85_01855 [Candidatus Nomurabacteria bacterium RIFCSPHIGHO2_02_FULL_37_13]OGI87806.1 MAG: hypothetical protein A2906_02125 [Candidatus Nomurabacteria bacterium RIFCSPLOWO2_01_FULL_37_25]
MSFFNKIKLYIIAHKVISAVVLFVVLYGGYWGYKKFTSTVGETRYVTTKVERGIIVASVSGTGQVSDINQIDIKSKASGDVVYIGATNGQKVYAGTLLVQLNVKDAQKSVRDAQISLEGSKLSLEKLKIQNSYENMNADLVKVYDDGFSAISDAFLDLPTIMTGLENLLAESSLSDNAARLSGNTALDYRNQSETLYYTANTAFNKNRKNYRTLNDNSPKQDIENIIKETYETTKLVSATIKNTVNFVDFMAKDSNNSSNFTSIHTTLSTYTDTINGHFSSLLTSQTNIKDNKDSLENNSLDIKSSELSVIQKENALQDAKDKLSDYFIRAPYAGTVANLDIKKSDSVNAGTIIATLITDKQLALISLNEVDVIKIKIEQKATFTFDAIPDLTISGTVTEIDPIGVVSQGVVTYDVKIGFDMQDERVKPSMSVSAVIITDMKQNVLIVQNSAIKSKDDANYVEMFDQSLPSPTAGLIGSISKIIPDRIPVEVGLSNDSRTEIISGIQEGDEIIIRTILPTTATTIATPSLFGSPANRGSGNAVRIPAGR